MYEWERQADRNTLFTQSQEELKETLVIVEDDASNALVLALLLENEGYNRTMCFESGEAVLAYLNAFQLIQPALFLIDYRLPGMNGLDLYERLCAMKGLKRVRALLLTAKNFSEKERSYLAQLHLSILNKPYDIEDILLSVQQIMN